MDTDRKGFLAKQGGLGSVTQKLKSRYPIDTEIFVQLFEKSIFRKISRLRSQDFSQK